MFDKLRNFIYDISDMVIAIAVVAILIYAVQWKINDTLRYENIMIHTAVEMEKSPDTENNGDLNADASEITNNQSADISNTVITDSSFSAEGSEITINPSNEGGQPTESQPETSGTTLNSNETTTATANPTTTIATNQEPIIFEIKSGQLGHTIGQNLKNAGFITDVNAFVKRAVELGLDSKMLIGRYKLYRGDSIDTILRIITGGKR